MSKPSKEINQCEIRHIICLHKNEIQGTIEAGPSQVRFSSLSQLLSILCSRYPLLVRTQVFYSSSRRSFWSTTLLTSPFYQLRQQKTV